MAFSSITSGEIASGQPNKNTLWNKVKDNFDNHESRIADLEIGTNIQYPPIIMRIDGDPSAMAGETNVLKTTCNFNLRITGIRILVDQAGASGTYEIDIQKKSGVSAYTSVLTTRPSIAYSAGSDTLSTNAVLHSTHKDCLSGDLLRLDINTVQSGGKNFLVRIDYERI